jgi:hypothetical protein
MNTPAYYCIDNFTTWETFDTSTVVPNAVTNDHKAPAARIYPNPATSTLNVDFDDNSVKSILILDMSGKIIVTLQPSGSHIGINTATLWPGTYTMRLMGDNISAAVNFIKQ